MPLIAFSSVPRVHDGVGRLLDEFWRDDHERSIPDSPMPAVDIAETPNDFILTVEVPGMSKEDIQVTLQQNTVSIKGTKKASSSTEPNQTRCAERAFGTFRRSFRLPKEVQAGAITAFCRDGILTITLPKAEAVKPHEIEIKF